MNVKTLTAAAAGAAALVLCALVFAAEGDSYPNKPVKFVVQSPPGGSHDLLARVLAGALSQSFGTQFFVENRVGASGNIGTEFVAKSQPDGHTLLFTVDFPFTINPSVYAQLPYDPIRDFAPVTLVTSMSFIMLAGPNFPPNSVQELIAFAKANPGKFNFASSGTGSQMHLAGEMFNTAAGVHLVHIPYKGFGLGVIDVMNGKVQITFATASAAEGYVRSGKLKALAVTGSKRYPGLPELPTLMESGLGPINIAAWMGVLAPALTPRVITDRLHAEIVKAIKSKELSKNPVLQGMDIVGAGRDEFSRRISSDMQFWAPIIKSMGIKADN